MSGIGAGTGRKICGGHYLIGGLPAASLTMKRMKEEKGEVLVVSAEVATAG